MTSVEDAQAHGERSRRSSPPPLPSPSLASTSSEIPVDVTVITHAEDPREVAHEIAALEKEEMEEMARTASPVTSNNEAVTPSSGSRARQSGTVGRADSDIPTDLGSDPTRSRFTSITPRGRRLESGLKPCEGDHSSGCDEAAGIASSSSPPPPQRGKDATPQHSANKPRRRKAAAIATVATPMDDSHALLQLVSPEKRRRIGQGAPELPDALRALYLAALAHQADRPHATPLLYTLQVVSEVYTAKRRLAAARRGRALEEARCDTLYRTGVEWRTKTEERRAKLLKQREEELLATCPFAPTLSRAARQTPPKGLEHFMEKCVAWEKEQADRLAARYAQEEELTAASAEPKIDPNSRAIAEALTRRGADARPALWEPKKPIDSQHIAAAGAQREESGVPVTSAEERRQRQRLRRILQGDNSGDPTSSSASSLAESRRRRVDMEEYVARMEQDLLRRSENAEKLRRRQELGDGGATYADITGQPLFQPNAMPTVLRDGKRIPYDKLSKKDQREFRRFLRENGQELALLRCSGTKGEEGSPGPSQERRQGERPSFAEDLAAALEIAATRKERNMARVLAQITAEETFHPHLTPRSVRLAKEKTGGVKIYHRPPAAKFDGEAIQKQREEEARLAKEKEAHRHSPATARAEQALTESMLARSAMWQERRERRLRQLAERRKDTEMAECTFSPRRALAHQLEDAVNGSSNAGAADTPSPAHARKSEEERAVALQRHRRRSSVYTIGELQQLASAADVRLANEVELLRAQTAHIDPAFLASVLEGEHSGSGVGIGEKDDGSLRRSPRRSRAAYRGPQPHGDRSTTHMGVRGTSRNDLPFRLDPPTLGTTLDPQYLLGNLTLINAPRLPQSRQQQRSRPSPSQSRSPSRWLASDRRSVLSEPSGGGGSSVAHVRGASSVKVPRSAHPSLSRSPLRREWQKALDGSHVGAAEQGGPARGLASDESDEEEADLAYLPDPWAALDAQVDHILHRYK